MDYGLEKCVLMAALPTLEDEQREAENATDATDTNSQNEQINIWSLKNRKEQAAAAHSNKENFLQRDGLVGTWDLVWGQTTLISDVMDCTSQSLLTFELACSAGACNLDFQQDSSHLLKGACPSVIMFT
jgi:hypothetical protein